MPREDYPGELTQWVKWIPREDHPGVTQWVKWMPSVQLPW